MKSSGKLSSKVKNTEESLGAHESKALKSLRRELCFATALLVGVPFCPQARPEESAGAAPPPASHAPWNFGGWWRGEGGHKPPATSGPRRWSGNGHFYEFVRRDFK